MEARPDPPTCPVCKSVIDKSRLIPLYGRGGGANQQDPRYSPQRCDTGMYNTCDHIRERVPPRPQGQREDAEDNVRAHSHSPTHTLLYPSPTHTTVSLTHTHTVTHPHTLLYPSPTHTTVSLCRTILEHFMMEEVAVALMYHLGLDFHC